MCKTVGDLDLHRSQEASTLIFHLLWLRGVERVSELALRMKDNCFAGKLSMIRAQTLLDFSRSQAFRNLL